MELNELLQYNPILVQCHDNPDADAIASGYALYRYLQDQGKDVRFVYGGPNKIQKSNLVKLIDYLDIEDTLEHVESVDDFLSTYHNDNAELPMYPGLLVTADCQYGAGNVTKIPTKKAAIIDHHQIEIRDVEMNEIVPNIGSCSTLLWMMLKNEGIEVTDIKLATALYYGLYTDSNAMGELPNPFDRDLRDYMPYEKSVIHMLKNSNFSLDEFEIAGIAMIRCIFNPVHKYAIVKSAQCDPNILGLISDFLLQVDDVGACIVYNSWPNGFKYSVRSCMKEVYANELASYMAEGIGSGGGHHEKAGGFISRSLYEEKYGSLPSEAFFTDRMNEYFDECEVIFSKDYDIDSSSMKVYEKLPVPFGYVMATDIFDVGTPITIRTLEGDFDMDVEENLVIMIGARGEVYHNQLDKFHATYDPTDKKLMDEVRFQNLKYVPTVQNRMTCEAVELSDMAKVCIAHGGARIMAVELDKRVKVFPIWDNDNYMLGKPGDFMAARCDDIHDIYIIEHNIFYETYKLVDDIDGESK